MSLDNYRETAYAWRTFRRMTETEVAAARTQELIATMQSVILTAFVGLLIAGAIAWMRAR